MMSRRRNHPGQLLRGSGRLAVAEGVTVKGTDSVSQPAYLGSQVVDAA